ncbi:MAG: geranylgeranylglycerol-phosphate geranylgeranyltransferase [Candidatus Eisenbacteria sp.]|nr:geranylgeranylglycerol-phosphate geranylgeranyltransferase [Candidatus Eisenbacteria bacterium]
MNRPQPTMSYLRLTRPANLLIAGISVGVGAAVSHCASAETVCPAIASAILIAAGGNAINDFFDRETDRVGKGNRPIPSGQVTAGGSVLFAGLLFLLGWVLSFRVGNGGFALVTCWVVLLVLYSSHLKRTGFAGNVVVSGVSASAFVLGGFAGLDPLRSLIPAVLAFLFHLGREIIKDVQDERGDAKAGVRSLAVQLGSEKALAIAAVVFGVLVGATLLPFALGYYNAIYLVMVIIGVDLPLVYVMIAILSGPSERRLGMLSGLLKIDMLVGIVCILIGSGIPGT